MADNNDRYRGYILPLKKTQEGNIRPAVPQGLLDLAHSAGIFGRAARGEPVDDSEAVKFALNFTGGGLGTPKPPWALGMGGGGARKPPITSLTAVRQNQYLDEIKRLQQWGTLAKEEAVKLRDKQLNVESGLEKIKAELTPGMSDSEIRFKLGRDRYQIYQELIQEQKRLQGEARAINSRWTEATKRNSELRELIKKLQGKIE